MTTIARIIDAAASLEAAGVQPFVFCEGEPTTHHWAVLRTATKVLGRQLTEPEVCALTLAKGYGDLPGVSPEVADRLWRATWPEGNPRGLHKPWLDTIDDLGLLCPTCGANSWRRHTCDTCGLTAIEQD